MAEPDEVEEDLFADLYDADENANGTHTTVPSQPAVIEQTNTGGNEPGYGEEPETAALPPSFDDQQMYMDDPMHGHMNDTNGGGDNDYSRDMAMMEDKPNVSLKEDGKMFIGGLNWETTDNSLYDYFSQFGEVQECTVMRDGATGRSRGFGFLTFKDPKTVNTVMVKEHFLDGKIIDPKRAIPKDEQEKTAKIFVGGVSQDATERDFTSFFEQFGRVVDATLMMDKDTGRPRGFGFVTFDSDIAVERCLENQPLEILGKQIEVKRAQPRGKMGEEEETHRGGRGRGKFGREERFGNDNQPSQPQAQPQGMMAGGMTPQMMAQYWQRMQSYFTMMQSQMVANAMGMNGMNSMNGMNPQMMAQMQQMQMMQQKQMQGGGSPMSQGQGGMPNMQGMTPQMQQQWMQQMMQQQQQQQQGGMSPMQGMGSVPTGPSGQRSDSFSASEQNAFEQRKYEQAGRGGCGGNRYFNQNQGQGPQSWEGMYDDVPQPNQDGRGSAGVVRNLTPGGTKAPKGPSTPQPSQAPANAPTGPKNPGKPVGNFRGGRGGRFHPYGR